MLASALISVAVVIDGAVSSCHTPSHQMVVLVPFDGPYWVPSIV